MSTTQVTTTGGRAIYRPSKKPMVNTRTTDKDDVNADIYDALWSIRDQFAAVKDQYLDKASSQPVALSAAMNAAKVEIQALTCIAKMRGAMKLQAILHA